MGEWFPSIDVFETKDNLLIKVEAPGMNKSDLSVVCHGHKLVVSGEKKQPKEDKRVASYICLERSFGNFERTIHIDQAVQMKKLPPHSATACSPSPMPKLKDRRGSEFRLTIEEID